MANLEEYDWMLINELAFKIHTIQNEADMRKTALDWLHQVIHFDLASFYLLSDKDGNFQYSEPVYQNFSEHALYLYQQQGESIDFSRWLFYNRKNFAYRESDLMSADKLRESDISKNFYQPLGIQYVCRMFLVYQSKLSGLITLYRKSPSEDFSDRDLYILNQLQDHLSYRLLRENCDFSLTSKLDEKYRKLISQYGLTDREMEVYLLTIRGLDNAAIAEKMCISPNTLKKHYSSIYNKMNISSRMQLLQRSSTL